MPFGQSAAAVTTDANEAERAADIDMHAGQTRAEQRFHVERAGGIATVEMRKQPLAVAGAQFGKERRFGGGARAVIERVAAADFRKPRRHRYQRCDADAAGDQDIDLAGLVERKIITRRRGLQQVADVELVVNIGRAAGAFGLAQYADHVAPRVSLAR